MKRLAALLLVLSLFAGPLGADCIQRARVVTNHVSYAQTYYPSYHYVPVAVFDAIKPVYAVGGGYRAETAETADLARALEKLTAAVDRLGKGGAQPQADNLQSKALGILNARCASCHSDATAKAGGDFVLLKGNQLNPGIDVLDVTHAISRARAGSMPPKSAGPQLSDDEISVLQHFGDELTKQVRAVRKTQTK